MPLSRWSASELAREAVARGICEQICGVTVWRWLSEDAIKPWQHRSWIFPRDPQFTEKAGRILDLYAGRWEGELLHPGDYVVCADEKPSIQARTPQARDAARRAGVTRGQRVEHEYERKGALCYLAAWDARRAKLFDRCAPKDGIVPVRRARRAVHDAIKPYSKAQRVFVIVDNGSAHRGQRSIDRLQGAWPNLILVHTPDPRQLAQPGRDLLLRRPAQGRSPPTTSPTSTRSSSSCSRSAAATSRSPRRSSGSSPATTSTAPRHRLDTTRHQPPPDPEYVGELPSQST